MEHPWLVEDDDETDDPVSKEPDKGVDMVEKGLSLGYGIPQGCVR